MLRYLVLIIFIPTSLTAQLDSASFWHKYENEVIYLSGSRYIKGTGIYSYKEIKYEFDQSPLGKEVYTMYQADKRKYYFFYITGMALYIPAFINFNNRNYKKASNLVLVSIASLAISIPISNAADKKLQKAIWIRNRDVLLAKPQ